MNKLKLILQFNYKSIILLFFLIIYVFVTTKVITYESKYKGNETFIEGQLINYSINGNVLKMDLKAKEMIKATYYIKSEEEKLYLENNILLGSNIKLTGQMKEAINNTIPNTFNYKKYLYNNKTFYLFTINDYELDDETSFFYKIKSNLLKRIYRMDNNEYLLIFILGDKSLVSSEEYNEFQINGTAHLLAISGMHIGLLVSILNKFLNRIKESRKFIIISIVLLFFGFLTGFSASVSRVIVFFIILNINKLLSLNYSNIKILFFTGFILISFNPFIIFDYGFIYSMVITFGILYYSKYLKGNYLTKLLKLSIITFLFSLPITALLNYEINLFSIVANLISVPLVVFFIYPLALFTILCSNPIWNISIELFIKLSSFLSDLGIIVNIPKIPWALIVLFYLVLILFRDKKKYLFLLILILMFNKLIYKIDRNYYVYFLDVGQGDSSVLISPYKKEIIMIDTGGIVEYKTAEWKKSSKSYNLSDNTIKFLKSIGVTKINYLIISHGDQDHAGEAINIINKISVKNVVLNKGEYNFIENNIKKEGKIKENYKLKYFDVHSLNNKVYNNENDNSIVNYIGVDKFNFLFLGDASTKVEEDILAYYNISPHIVKLGHHGSKTSTGISLLSLDFDIAIISSGRNNRYNHPSKEVIDSLDKNKKKYYNTQTMGTIMFKINDGAYNIKTFMP